MHDAVTSDESLRGGTPGGGAGEHVEDKPSSGVFRRMHGPASCAQRGPHVVVAQAEWARAQALAAVMKAKGYVTHVVHTREDLVDALGLRGLTRLITATHVENGEVMSLVAQALASTPELQVLFVSERTDKETLAAAAAAHPVGFVAYPCSTRQLAAAAAVGFTTPSTGSEAAASEMEDAKQSLARAQQAILTIKRALQEAGVCAAGGISFDCVEGAELLSEREREVVTLLAGHRRTAAIAQELGISPHTVRKHLKNVFAKFGVHSQEELLALVFERARRKP